MLKCDHNWIVSYGTLQEVKGHMCLCQVVTEMQSPPPALSRHIAHARTNDEAKARLPVFTPWGRFRVAGTGVGLSGRSIDDWQKPSGWCPLDLDYLSEQSKQYYAEKLPLIPAVGFAATSPRGQGLKVLVHYTLPRRAARPTDTRTIWQQVTDHINAHLEQSLPPTQAPKGYPLNDPAVASPTQPMFLTTDPAGYYGLSSATPIKVKGSNQRWAPSLLPPDEDTKADFLKLVKQLGKTKLHKGRLNCPICRHKGSVTMFTPNDGSARRVLYCHNTGAEEHQDGAHIPDQIIVEMVNWIGDPYWRTKFDCFPEAME